MSRWVLGGKVTEEMGLSAGQLRGMRQRGILARDVHYTVRDRKIFYDLEALQEWLSTEASARRAQASRSDTRSEGGESRATSTHRRPKPVYRMQLASAGD